MQYRDHYEIVYGSEKQFYKYKAQSAAYLLTPDAMLIRRFIPVAYKLI